MMQDAPPSRSAQSVPPQIRFEQVSLKAPLGPTYLLKSLSFSLMEGDRLAIVGPSGAGKTSLLRLINRLSDPSEGTIFYGAQPLQHCPVLQLRRDVPFVLQEPRLLGMTVRETLMYPLKLRQLAVSEIEQRLHHWMERLHIPADWLDRTELQLSVGQRQLVAIARALILQPRLLLLDEPTAALDVGRRSQLMDTLLDYAKTAPCTMMMVSHDLDLAQQFCSKLLYLDQGCIVEHLASDAIDWPQIKANIIAAEQRQQAEWDDEE